VLLSTILDRVLEKINQLQPKKIPAILGLFLVIVIFTNGIFLVPPEQYQRLSQNPFITRTDIDIHNYWQETILLPVVAYYTQLTSRLSFNGLCFLILEAAFLLFAQFTLKREGPTATLIFSAILMSGPLTTVTLAWLGSPDGLTFALTVPILFVNSSLSIFFLAILGSMNHFAFTIAAAEILALRWVARDGIKVYQLIALAIGGMFGYIFVKLFLAFNHIQIMTRFDYIFSKNLMGWVSMNAANFPMTLFSLFNVQWLVIPVCLIMFFRFDKFFFGCLLTILALNLGITFFTEDSTRIFSLLSWGVLMECIFHAYKLALNQKDNGILLQKQFLQALMVIGFISLITPRYFSWNGEIHPSSFYVFIMQVIKGNY
jgi:hypothetical protein